MHTRFAVIFTLILVFTILLFTNVSATPLIRHSNDLVFYISKLKNKIPNRYIEPGNEQLAILRSAGRKILAGNIADATLQANAVGYTVRGFNHKNNGKTYYIMEAKDPKARPWGTYIFHLGSEVEDIVIEVPHPAEEKNTAAIGIKAFIDLNAKTFLLSGSRRTKCDVAYTGNCVFSSMHVAVTTKDTDVLQIHGFKIYNYPQIVITSGSPVVNTAMDAYIAELVEDFDVGIYNGIEYVKVASTENVQAQHTNSIIGNFMGIFLNRAVHHSQKMSNKFINALVEVSTTETST